MRFGQKIFCMSFVLVIVVIQVIGMVMIQYTYQANMEKEIEKNMLQINTIMRTITGEFKDLAYVATSYRKHNVHMEVYLYGRKTFTNFKEEEEPIGEILLTEEDTDSGLYELYEEYGVLTSDMKETMNADNGNKNVLEHYMKESNGSSIQFYIQGDTIFMKMREGGLILLTASDIAEVNQMREEQLAFFSKVSLFSSFFIACIIWMMTRFLTRKIKRLNTTVERIGKGDYTAKVEKLGNDEIGNFGNRLNAMTTAIQENIAHIQKVSENRRLFIGNITHEIRTPLTSIIGYSSLMKNRKVTDAEVMVEYAQKIHEEGKYMEKMSERLMSMLLLENQAIVLENVSLSEELKKIVQGLEGVFPEVQFEMKLAENVWGEVDRTLFQSLITNLVKNAMAAYEQNPVVRIELDEKREIRVIDYGKGIPEEELEKIKEPFYTLHKDRNRRTSGMGLGLPLCFKIVEVQNGKLEIHSTEHVGTEIVIQLGGEDER